LVEHLADHLGPVVEDDLAGQPAGLGRAVQDPHDTGTRQRGVDLDRRAFAAKSSTMLSVRKRWPVARRSCWKSMDQRWFGACGTSMGWRRALASRFLLRWRTCRPSST
jgi:hypothetical protein